MSLKKNESDIEHIAYSDRKVYSVLSDLRNLKKLESNFEDEEKRRILIAQLGEEKVKKANSQSLFLFLFPDFANISSFLSST